MSMKIKTDCKKMIKEIQQYKYTPEKKTKNKLKYLNEWGLDKRATHIVKRELSKWVDEFLNRADNARYKVEVCNFKENKLFFFTTCHDKLKDDPEATGIETDMDIRKRKRQICYALLLKQLMGEEIPQWDHKCSHCGNTNMIIELCGNSSYTRYCPDCKRFVIDTYESDFVLMSSILYKKYIKKDVKK